MRYSYILCLFAFGFSYAYDVSFMISYTSGQGNLGNYGNISFNFNALPFSEYGDNERILQSIAIASLSNAGVMLGQDTLRYILHDKKRQNDRKFLLQKNNIEMLYDQYKMLRAIGDPSLEDVQKCLIILMKEYKKYETQIHSKE